MATTLQDIVQGFDILASGDGTGLQAKQPRELAAGGPGSGCHGSNCGRHGGGKGTDKTHVPKSATVHRYDPAVAHRSADDLAEFKSKKTGVEVPGLKPGTYVVMHGYRYSKLGQSGVRSAPMPHKIEVSDYKDGRGPQIGSVTHPNLSDVGKVTGHNIGTGYHSKMEDIALSIRQGGGSPKYMGTSYRSKTSDATDRHIEKWISKNSKS